MRASIATWGAVVSANVWLASGSLLNGLVWSGLAIAFMLVELIWSRP